MSDDLVKRLRAMLEGDMRPSPLGKRAADRIKKLEANLAKAVGALHKFADDPWSIARTTLAELKGQDDE